MNEAGAICARTFVQVRPHPAIGVLDGISVVTALLLGDVGDDTTAHATCSTVLRAARPLFDGTVCPAHDPWRAAVSEPAPRHEVAHLELRTPEPEKSLDLVVRVLGSTENGSDGASVHLRTSDDHEQCSRKLAAASTSGVGRTAVRASSQEGPAATAVPDRARTNVDRVCPQRHLPCSEGCARSSQPCPRSSTPTRCPTSPSALAAPCHPARTGTP